MRGIKYYEYLPVERNVRLLIHCVVVQLQQHAEDY